MRPNKFTSAFALNWRSDGKDRVPSVTDPVIDCAFGYAVNYGPVGDNHGRVAYCHPAISSFISRLFVSCGPFAVLFAVWAIVVYSVYGQALSVGGSHISEEVLKNEPFVTHCYPAASVPHISRVFGVQASFFHSIPDLVNTGMAFPVLCATYTGKLPVEASATLIVSSCDQCALYDRFDCAAVAPANPCSPSLPIRSNNRCAFSHDGVASVFEASQIDVAVERLVCYDAFRHGASPAKNTVFRAAGRPRIVRPFALDQISMYLSRGIPS